MRQSFSTYMMAWRREQWLHREDVGTGDRAGHPVLQFKRGNAVPMDRRVIASTNRCGAKDNAGESKQGYGVADEAVSASPAWPKPMRMSAKFKRFPTDLRIHVAEMAAANQVGGSMWP